VYIDDDEPDELIEATAEAADRWNDRIGYDVLDVRVIKRARAAYLDPSAIVVKSQREVRGPESRRGNTVGGRIAIEVDVMDGDYERLAYLVSHEVGHALGLGHSSLECNTMSDGWQPCKAGPRVQVTEQQIRRVRALAAVTVGMF
jgi:predicted metal-dependent hydrolase